ncbi:hypothetical protein M9H77_36130 [Catharanthus roseus]|uniref:Uncharacterized protein n=1 Tax=Catharanthus roseus TaxID=4058 RepID=A0ACB9ZUN5_CATRO|nr:hypothetical protein M9H77_36130 [Catharanthus roseus]
MESPEGLLQENVGFERSRTSDRRPYVTLACERGGAVKKYTKPIVDDEEEKIPIKRRGPYGTEKCSENWQLFIHNGRHNHKIVFRKSHMPPRNILRFFSENETLVVHLVLRKFTVEEVLYLSAQRGYTVFYRNCEESNVLSDIIVAHPDIDCND